MRIHALAVVIPAAVLATACASKRGAPHTAQVADRIRERTGHEMRIAPGEPGLPAGVSLDDGLTQDAAVAIALWNNPAFQADLADIGLARADLLQARMLRNPVLTLLFPWGPKQLEATLKWPVEALWLRSRRIAAARRALDAVAERLTGTGLDLVADAKLAFVDLVVAIERSNVAAESANVVRRIGEVVQARLRAGDISELEASLAELDVERAEQDARRAALDVTIAQDRLHEVLDLGTSLPAGALKPQEPSRPAAGACTDIDAVDRDALASRPDLRAAELSMEAAATRLGWERSRLTALVGILDANAKGTEGFEMGPGVEAEIPLDGNRVGSSRAEAELDRAKARYRVVQQRVLRDVHDAHAQLLQAEEALGAWGARIRPRLEQQLDRTKRAHEDGEVPYLAVLEASRRLNEGRAREIDASADERRAFIRLERSVGRSCSAGPR